MSDSQKPHLPTGAVQLPGGQSVADAVVQAHRDKKNALSAAAAAGPPPKTEDAVPPPQPEGLVPPPQPEGLVPPPQPEGLVPPPQPEGLVPPPQPEYVRCQLSDGRKSYVPKSSHIYVEGIGMLRIADILNACEKKDVDLSAAIAQVAPAAQSGAGSPPGSASGRLGAATAAGSAYTTMGGEQVDLDLPFMPEFVNDALENAAEAVRDAALSGPEFTDTLVEKVEDFVVDQAKAQEVAETRKTFLERRIAQERRVNHKITLAEEAVLGHPGIHQPVDFTVSTAKGTGRLVEKTKPKEVKVVCNIM